MITSVVAAIPVVVERQSFWDKIPQGFYVIAGALIAALAGLLTQLWTAQRSAENAKALAMLTVKIRRWEELQDATTAIPFVVASFLTHNLGYNRKKHAEAKDDAAEALDRLSAAAHHFPANKELEAAVDQVGEMIRSLAKDPEGLQEIRERVKGSDITDEGDSEIERIHKVVSESHTSLEPLRTLEAAVRRIEADL